MPNLRPNLKPNLRDAYSILDLPAQLDQWFEDIDMEAETLHVWFVFESH
jgi:hypothetical protein